MRAYKKIYISFLFVLIDFFVIAVDHRHKNKKKKKKASKSRRNKIEIKIKITLHKATFNTIHTPCKLAHLALGLQVAELIIHG